MSQSLSFRFGGPDPERGIMTETVYAVVTVVPRAKDYAFALTEDARHVFLHCSRGRLVGERGNQPWFEHEQDNCKPKKGERLIMKIQENKHGWRAIFWGRPPEKVAEPDTPMPHDRQATSYKDCSFLPMVLELTFGDEPYRQSILSFGNVYELAKLAGVARIYAEEEIELRVLRMHDNARKQWHVCLAICEYIKWVAEYIKTRSQPKVNLAVHVDDLINWLRAAPKAKRSKDPLETCIARAMINRDKGRPFLASRIISEAEGDRHTGSAVTAAFKQTDLSRFRFDLSDRCSQMAFDFRQKLLECSFKDDLGSVDSVWTKFHKLDRDFCAATSMQSWLEDWEKVGEFDLIEELAPLLEADERYSDPAKYAADILERVGELSGWEQMQIMLSQDDDIGETLRLYEEYIVAPGLEEEFFEECPQAKPRLEDLRAALEQPRLQTQY